MKIEEKPSWTAGRQIPDFPKLEKNLKTDVVIIGAGLAGILTAYSLARAGREVIVLEKSKIGSGATEYTTAFVTQAIDTDYTDLVSMFGEEDAKLVWRSGAEAISVIEKIVHEEHIDCEFKRTSVMVYANSKKDYEQLRESYQAESEAGFDVGAPVQDIKYNFRNYGYYEIKNQAKFHPLKFLSGLVAVCQKLGVQIFEESEVTKIHHQESGVEVATASNIIEAKSVVVATYQPFHNRMRLFLKRGMYKSYVFEAKLPKGLIQEGLYWDTANPYHYFRIDAQEHFDRMIIGGEDIKTIVKMDDEKNFQALEDYLKSLLGNDYELTRRWTGQVLEPSDGLPLIGKVSDGEYVATAFSGNGMTYSAISAMLLTDLILGNRNIYAEIYDPKRLASIRQLFIKGSDYIEEFFGGAAKNILKKPSENPGT